MVNGFKILNINLISFSFYGILVVVKTIRFCTSRKRGFFMEKREFAFITGEVATYNLASCKLNALTHLVSASSICDTICDKVSENIYYVSDLESVQKMYDLFISSPEEGGSVSKVYFFTGNFFYLVMTEEDLQRKLEKLKTRFSCAELTPDAYKVYAL